MSFDPKKRYTSMELVDAGWLWTPSSTGTFTNESVQTAALVEVARKLRSINDKLDQLGVDGIHQLIREVLTETRAKRRARLNRRKVKP